MSSEAHVRHHFDYHQGLHCNFLLLIMEKNMMDQVIRTCSMFSSDEKVLQKAGLMALNVAVGQIEFAAVELTISTMDKAVEKDNLGDALAYLLELKRVGWGVNGVGIVELVYRLVYLKFESNLERLQT